MLCVMLCLGLMTTVFASEISDGYRDFLDIPVTSEYYEPIREAQRMGYVSGTGGGYFTPDGYFTIEQVLIVMSRAMPSYDAAKALREIYSVKSLDGMQKSPVKAAQLAQLIFQARMLPSYDARVYRGGTYADAGENAFVTARVSGLFPGEYDGNSQVKRDVGVSAITKAFAEDFRVTRPVVYEIYNVEEDVPGENSEAFVLWNIVPQSLKEVFREDGWSFHTGTIRLDEWAKENVGYFDKNDPRVLSIVGLTSYKDKCIYMVGENTILHELGHYVAYRSGYHNTESLNVLFNMEHAAAAKLLGKYSQQNANEYFGEAFDYYIRNRTNPAGLDALGAVAPQTLAMLQGIEALNWAKVL